MPFDLDATTHAFEPMDFGGIQTVVADVPTVADQIALVRAHPQAEAAGQQLLFRSSATSSLGRDR